MLNRTTRRISFFAGTGALLVAGSAVAAAAIVLHGQADLVVEPVEGAGLEVTGVRLSAPLDPGDVVGVVFDVRNRSIAPVTADRLTARLPLSGAKPAGCTARLSGPLLTASGVRLTGAQRVVVGSGEQRQVVVPAVLKLSANSRTGCGFRVTLDVQAIQSPATTPPTVTPTLMPTTAEPPEPTPTVTLPTAGTTSPPPVIPTTTPACEAVDPICTPS